MKQKDSNIVGSLSMTDILFNYVLRNLAKYTYKFLHPKSYKHNRRDWPFTKSYVILKDILKKFISEKNSLQIIVHTLRFLRHHVC